MKTLLSVSEFIIDTKHNTPNFTDVGIPCVRTPNIGRGRLILDTNIKYVSQETYLNWIERAIPKENDLIFAREAPVGNVAIITKGQTVCIGQRTVLIRPNIDEVDPNYLCYYLLSEEMQESIKSKSGGSTVPHLNMSDIRSLKLPNIHPRHLQTKISSILTAFDDLIENNLKRIKLLEEAAELIYREWFVNLRFPGHENVKVVDGVPEGWIEHILLKDYQIYYGKNLSGKLISQMGDYPVYGAAGQIGFYSRKNCDHKVVLITSRGNGSGEVHRTFEDEAFITNNSFTFIPNSNELDICYVFQFAKTLNLKNYTSGSAQPQLTINSMTGIKYLKPNVQVVKKYVDLTKDYFELTDNLRIQNNYLKEARDLLLPKLMNGEIDLTKIKLETIKNSEYA